MPLWIGTADERRIVKLVSVGSVRVSNVLGCMALDSIYLVIILNGAAPECRSTSSSGRLARTAKGDSMDI